MDVPAQSEESFVLGDPALVCRWRLAGGSLMLENRHIRALSRRLVMDGHLAAPLLAWTKQHVEWTLRDGSAQHPDGVLMLVIDGQGRAAMTVGPYRSLARCRVTDLMGRAGVARQEADSTGVAPESLWVVSEGRLLWGIEEGCAPSGSASLIEDLARTLGTPIERCPGLERRLAGSELPLSEAFLVSDEHGVVCAADARGAEGERFLKAYQRLQEKASRH
ncbi:hypothetical protein [Olsenella urininfantis]|uniref:hypothetical protein n=1 Tax=Olsenella urininfantis TaxID=1871033 RepID=UPI000986AA7D|nr:hypothetical protein [Olsenella urininfantis]